MALKSTISAGRLRHLVSLQQKQQTGTGDRGQPTFTWVTIAAAVPACIEPIAPMGDRTTLGKQQVAYATHQVEMRYYPGLTEEWQIVWQGRTFAVKYLVDVDARQVKHVAYCVEQRSGI